MVIQELPSNTVSSAKFNKVELTRNRTGRGNDIAYTQVHHVISGKCRVKVTSSRSPVPHGPLFGLTVSMRVHFHIHLLEVGCKPTPPLPATAIRVYRSAIGAVHCVVHDSSGLSGQVNGRPLIAARTRLHHTPRVTLRPYRNSPRGTGSIGTGRLSDASGFEKKYECFANCSDYNPTRTNPQNKHMYSRRSDYRSIDDCDDDGWVGVLESLICDTSVVVCGVTTPYNVVVESNNTCTTTTTTQYGWLSSAPTVRIFRLKVNQCNLKVKLPVWRGPA